MQKCKRDSAKEFAFVRAAMRARGWRIGKTLDPYIVGSFVPQWMPIYVSHVVPREFQAHTARTQ